MEKLKKYCSISGLYIKNYIIWLLLGITIGILCGGVGGIFAKSIAFVTDYRFQNNKLIFLLPVLGLVSVFIYKLCRVSDVGTNNVLKSVQSEEKVPILLAPAIFIGTIITHLCGGSAGKEGAALQLGGSISTLVSKVLRLNSSRSHILTICSMAGLFSAVFGTPLGACIFAIEVIRVGYIYSAALFPTLVSSITAYSTACLLKAPHEKFTVTQAPDFNHILLIKIVVIAILGAVVSIIFCRTLHISEKLFKKFIKNPYLRIASGGIIIIALSFILRTTDYQGGGINIIEEIFSHGRVHPEAFILKIIFTAITVGSGFKGGEIVPTLFIGATLGGALAVIMSIDPALGAAVGMAALFCGVTNCPLATLFLSLELFGTNGFLLLAIACFTSFVLSGYVSLYTGQKIIFSKTEEGNLPESNE
jgi:H+/Cl- antiporter ClcA